MGIGAGTGSRRPSSTIHRKLALHTFSRIALGLAAVLFALRPHPASAQSPDNVLLVINEQSPDSVRIGEHYARVRAIPQTNVARIKAPIAELISRAEFERSIEAPLGQWLSRHLLQDQILYIVLTKGVALRVDGTGGQSASMASVDSELTLLYRKMIGRTVLTAGRIDNPYYLAEKPLAQARRFSRLDGDLYLVTRLDGFSADDVVKLIDRGVRGTRDGKIVLDQKATIVDRGGDMWLAETANRLTDAGHGGRVQLETTKSIAATTDPVLGYFSWGSNDPANQLRVMGLQFAPGAIGGMYVSTDGRTFREPPAGWKPAVAGSATGGQTLVGDLIREGITGVAANVAEPYLDAIVRPQILFPAYLSGFTLAESYYLAMPYLSWQTAIIGDPLTAPFLSTPLTQTQIHRGLDAEVALPALFAERRLAAMLTGDLKREGVRLALKSDSLRAQGKPNAEVEAALEKATELEPRLLNAHLLLAEDLSSRGEYDRAVVRFQAILKQNANHVIALNNLAYLLADKKGTPAEALPLAEKAYRLANQAPMIADTLGWVHFKMNQPAMALPLIERAAAVLTGDVDVQVHAAAVNLALDRRDRAKIFLDAALKADPQAASRADVKAIMAKIKQ